MTVADLCARYVADGRAGKVLRRGKPKKSIEDDAARIKNHVVPLIGRLPVADVTRMDIERLLHAVAEGRTGKVRDGLPVPRGGKGVATRSVAMLGGIFSFGRKLGVLETNPCQFVETFAVQRRNRRLDDAEYAQLASALRPYDAIIRFLCLTGWRSGEARELRWEDCDLPRRVAHLVDSKTGPCDRVLPSAAIELLKSQPRFLHSALVFPGTRNLINIEALMRRLRRDAGLPRDITAHVLRHSFASEAADAGLSQFTIGALMGHSVPGITATYVHLSDPALRLASDTVADRIAALMDGTVTEVAAAQ
jgi:integrase